MIMEMLETKCFSLPKNFEYHHYYIMYFQIHDDLESLIQSQIFSEEPELVDIVLVRLIERFIWHGFDGTYSKRILDLVSHAHSGLIEITGKAIIRTNTVSGNTQYNLSMLLTKKAWSNFLHMSYHQIEHANNQLLGNAKSNRDHIKDLHTGAFLSDSYAKEFLPILIIARFSKTPDVLRYAAIQMNKSNESIDLSIEREVSYLLLKVVGLKEWLKTLEQMTWLRLEVVIFAVMKNGFNSESVEYTANWLSKNKKNISFGYCGIDRQEIEAFKLSLLSECCAFE